METHCNIIVGKTLVCDVMPCPLFPLFPPRLYPASSWMPWTDTSLPKLLQDERQTWFLQPIYAKNKLSLLGRSVSWIIFQWIANLQFTDENLLGISHSQRLLAPLHTHACTHSRIPAHNKHMHNAHTHHIYSFSRSLLICTMKRTSWRLTTLKFRDEVEVTVNLRVFT